MSYCVAAWMDRDLTVTFQIRKSHKWYKAIQIKDGIRRCLGIGANKPSKKQVEEWFNYKQPEGK